MTDTVEEVAAEDSLPNDQQEATLSLNDINLILSVIDVCSKRGAFEGGDLEVVGGLRTRLVNFINSVKPQDDEDQAADTED